MRYQLVAGVNAASPMNTFRVEANLISLGASIPSRRTFVEPIASVSPSTILGTPDRLLHVYAVQEAGLKRRSTISHSRVEPHDLASFGAASI